MAVVVSLHLARSASKARLRVSVGKRVQTGAGPPEHWNRLVVFNVQNVGQRPVHVESLGWATGVWPFEWPARFARRKAIIAYWSEAFAGAPPYGLAPYKRQSSINPLDALTTQITEWGHEDYFFARKWFGKIRRTPVYGVVHLEEGSTVYVRVERSLEDALLAAERSKGVELPPPNPL